MEKIQYIDPTSEIGDGTEIGHFVVIEKGVTIGESCVIGSNVVVHAGTRIGRGVRVDDNTVIGKSPMRAKRSIFKTEKNLEPAQIGDFCLIGAQVILYQGCYIGSHVLIADSAAVRENVSVGEYTIVGRGVTIENLTKVGKKCKLETGSYITAYSEIEDYCFIAPMVTTTNDNYLGRTGECHNSARQDNRHRCCRRSGGRSYEGCSGPQGGYRSTGQGFRRNSGIPAS
jgi:UDP-2-acetamido-3-amino-2,3-dideoxy-glucuronate N-acetyltransferase